MQHSALHNKRLSILPSTSAILETAYCWTALIDSAALGSLAALKIQYEEQARKALITYISSTVIKCPLFVHEPQFLLHLCFAVCCRSHSSAAVCVRGLWIFCCIVAGHTATLQYQRQPSAVFVLMLAGHPAPLQYCLQYHLAQRHNSTLHALL